MLKSCIQISSNKMHIKCTKIKVPTFSEISSDYLFIIIDFIYFFTLCKRYVNVVTGQNEVNLKLHYILNNA